MNNHKQKILKLTIGIILTTLILVLGLFAYSENIHKIGFIENAKNTILQLIGDNSRTADNQITTIDITGITPTPESEHEHIYKTHYDDTKHWEECTVCGIKRNEQTHSLTTTWALRI